jgi:hypothetical protein
MRGNQGLTANEYLRRHFASKGGKCKVGESKGDTITRKESYA